MELFSKSFKKLVERILRSNQTVLAVIHQRNDPFTRNIRALANIEEWSVTEKNRDALPVRILEKMGRGRNRDS
jgi:nucleoside-triphosphatase THEP1